MFASTGSTITAKVVLLGDARIGAKTSLMQRFLKGRCDEYPSATVSAGLGSKSVEVDGVEVELGVWGLRPHFKTKTHIVVNTDVYMHRHRRVRTLSFNEFNIFPRCTGSNCGL